MAILVCGGAGYIGSHAVHALAAAGQEVVVVDNLQTGHAAAVAGKAAFVQGDIRDAACLDGIFRRFRIDGVMHFAADSQVGESMVDPLKYFNNNVGGMQSLLEAMVRHGVGRIVFSSSAAVYGEPDSVPISEDAPTRPTNPYGYSKLMMEAMMRWVSVAHGIRYVSCVISMWPGPWPTAASVRTTAPRAISSPWCCQCRWAGGRISPSSVMITLRPTGPASVTTSPSPIWWTPM